MEKEKEREKKRETDMKTDRENQTRIKKKVYIGSKYYKLTPIQGVTQLQNILC